MHEILFNILTILFILSGLISFGTWLYIDFFTSRAVSSAGSFVYAKMKTVDGEDSSVEKIVEIVLKATNEKYKLDEFIERIKSLERTQETNAQPSSKNSITDIDPSVSARSKVVRSATDMYVSGQMYYGNLSESASITAPGNSSGSNMETDLMMAYYEPHTYGLLSILPRQSNGPYSVVPAGALMAIGPQNKISVSAIDWKKSNSVRYVLTGMYHKLRDEGKISDEQLDMLLSAISK